MNVLHENSNNLLEFPIKNQRHKDNAEIDKAVEYVVDLKFREAEKILIQLIDEGCDDAYVFLGGVYEFEPESNPILNYKKAYFYYQKSIETTGSVEAYLAVARFCRYGYLGYTDHSEAIKIYLELIDQNVYLGGFTLWTVGTMYANAWGVERDQEKAEDFFRKGWDRKHIPSLGWLGKLRVKNGHYCVGSWMIVKAFILSLFYGISNKDSQRIRIS